MKCFGRRFKIRKCGKMLRQCMENDIGCRVFYGIFSMVAPRHRQYGAEPHSSQNRCQDYYNMTAMKAQDVYGLSSPFFMSVLRLLWPCGF